MSHRSPRQTAIQARPQATRLPRSLSARIRRSASLLGALILTTLTLGCGGGGGDGGAAPAFQLFSPTAEVEKVFGARSLKVRVSVGAVAFNATLRFYLDDDGTLGNSTEEAELPDSSVTFTEPTQSREFANRRVPATGVLKEGLYHLIGVLTDNNGVEHVSKAPGRVRLKNGAGGVGMQDDDPAESHGSVAGARSDGYTIHGGRWGAELPPGAGHQPPGSEDTGTGGDDPDVPDKLAKDNLDDGWVSIQDPAGTAKALIHIGGDGNVQLADLAVDSDNSFVVVGRFTQEVIFNRSHPNPALAPERPLTTSSMAANDWDGFIARYTNGANPEDARLDWVVHISGPENQLVNSVAFEAPRGRVVVAGTFGGATSFYTDDPAPTGVVGLSDAFAAYYSERGVFAERRLVQGSGAEEGSAVGILDEGAVVLVGQYTESLTLPGTATPINPIDNDQAGDRDIFYVGLNQDGSGRFAGRAGGSDDDAVSDVAVFSTNQWAAVGHFTGAAEFNPDDASTPRAMTSHGSDDADIFFMQRDSAGGDVMAGGGGSPGNDYAYAIQPEPDDAFWVVGEVGDGAEFGDTPETMVTLSSRGGQDALIVRYSSNCKLEFASADGSPGDDAARAIALTPTGVLSTTGSIAEDAEFGGEEVGLKITAGAAPSVYFARFNGDGTIRFGTLLHTFTGTTGMQIGDSLARLNDTNGDGSSELVVGEAHAGSVVRIYSNLALIHTLNPEQAGESLGRSGALARMGDVNNDGIDDLLVGAWENDTNGADAGAARIYSGADGSIIRTMLGDGPGDLFGRYVIGSPDLTGDGVWDYVISAPGDITNPSTFGYARVFDGATGAPIVTLTSTEGDDGFGPLTRPWNWDGLGFRDIFVGAPLADSNGVDAGRVYVFNKLGTELTAASPLVGDGPNARFGASLVRPGDVTGDGDPDLVVGAPGEVTSGGKAGYLEIYEMGASSATHRIDGPKGAGFGAVTAYAGDLDGDGFRDLLVGSPQDSSRGEKGGAGYVYSGNSADSWAILGSAAHSNENAMMGSSVVGGGDFNGDGVLDFAIGRVGVGGDTGKIYVVSGGQ